MDRLKSMKESLMNCVQTQMGNLQQVDAKELGEAIDMIKDLEEAIYYNTITKAMESKDKEHHYYYTERYMYPPENYRDIDKDYGKRYYDEYSVPYYASTGARQSYEKEYPIVMRDHREGKSPMSRKTYMEAKEMQHDKSVKLKELENYVQELTHDMVEMIEDASAEEKQFLEKKVSMLATKIGQLSKNG